MSGAYSPYTLYMPPAFVGMKVDSMDDNVESWAANADILIGTVVTRLTAAGTDKKAVQGGAGAILGIALHDHIIASWGMYKQYDAVSVLTRGRVWARVGLATSIKDGTPVYYTAADGKVQAVTAGGVLVPHATFRSGVITVPDVSMATGGIAIAAVELHYPMQIENVGTIT